MSSSSVLSPESGKTCAAVESGYRVSLVLPAWNEQDVIAQAIDEATQCLRLISTSFEVLVVDDGSTDRTAEIVRRIAGENPCVRLISQPENCGYGAALRAGFEAAEYELVAFTDADCQFDLSELELLLPLTKRYEIVTGYRIDRKDSPLRLFYSWGYNTLIRLLMGSPVRDVDCALKVFRRDALARILPTSRRFFANTEMITEARLQGLSIVEIGVQHRPRAAGQSSVSISDVPKTLSSLLPYWWQRVQFPGDRLPNVGSASAAFFAFTLLMVITAFLLFRQLSHPLFEPDEGRYAEIARAMWSSGDWVVPRLFREPYLDKPPLFYWLCATSFSIFGPTAQAARYVPAASALLTVALTFLFGRRLLGLSAAFHGTLILVLSLGFVCSGRFVMLDSVLTLFVTLSLFSAYEAVRSERFLKGWWVLSAVACGLGILTKGPVAFALLAPPVFAHTWLTGGKVAHSWKRWVAYGGIAAGISMPWYVAITNSLPGFGRHFFWEHNIQRFLSGSNHPQPFWFYIPTILLATMPWGGLLIPLAGFLTERRTESREDRTRNLGFLTLWSGWCVLFFSLSSGKLPAYILPCLPSIVLLTGAFLQARCSPFARELRQQLSTQHTFTLGIRLLAPVIAASAVTGNLMGLLTLPLTAMLVAGCGCALAMSFVTSNRWSARSAWMTFCVLAFATTMSTSQVIFPAWARRQRVLSESQMEVLAEAGAQHTPIVCVSGNWGSVPFYLNRNDVQIVSDGESDTLKNHVSREESTLMIVDDEISGDGLRDLLPKRIPVTPVSSPGKSSLFRVGGRQEPRNHF